MSTDAFLSINRCLEEIYPSATEDAQYLTILSLNKPVPEMQPLEQQVLKLYKRISHRKKVNRLRIIST